jgi:hypothetical protein
MDAALPARGCDSVRYDGFLNTKDKMQERVRDNPDNIRGIVAAIGELDGRHKKYELDSL